MKKALALALTLAMLFSLCACGSSSDTTTPSNETPSNTTVEDVAPTENNPVEDVVPDEKPVESEPVEGKAEPISVAVGETITLDFVEISIDEVGVAEDIKRSITNGNVTRTSGPETESGMSFIYIDGIIKNLDTNKLPVYDYFIGEFLLDKYSYEIDTNDCDIINANGEPLSTIAPLTTGSFRLYATIPNELATTYQSATFTFGFYDMFDNQELSYHKAFTDDPIAECPYQYIITLK